MNLDVKGTEVGSVRVEVERARVNDYLRAVHAAGLTVLAETAYEVVRSPRIGEELTAVTRIEDVFVKETRSRMNAFAVVDVRFCTDTGELVFSQRLTFIARGPG